MYNIIKIQYYMTYNMISHITSPSRLAKGLAFVLFTGLKNYGVGFYAPMGPYKEETMVLKDLDEI